MKKITKTITSRIVELRAYDEINDMLFDDEIVITGEKFNGSVERKYEPNRQALKIKNVHEPITATYTMSVDDFMRFALESDVYMHGFINRKIGGKIAICKVYNLNTDTVETVEIADDTEKRISKELENDNLKLLVILERKAVDEKFYYMSDKEFMVYSDR